MFECRICLEEDDIQNMITPCLCKGSRKYVHRKCLNEWRICSNDEDSKNKCTICNFEYIIKDQKQCENNLLMYAEKIKNSNKLNIISNVMKLLLITLVTFCFSKNYIAINIKSIINENILNIDIFTISSYILNLIYNLFLILRILFSKNKIIIIKYYFNSGIILILFYNLISIVLIFLLPLLGFMFNLVFSFFYLKIIFEKINKMNKTDNLQIICLSEYDSLNI